MPNSRESNSGRSGQSRIPGPSPDGPNDTSQESVTPVSGTAATDPEGGLARLHGRVPGLPFYAIGACIVAMGVLRFVLTGDGMLLDAVELGILLSLALVYVFAGRRIATRVSEANTVRIAGLSALFGVVGALLSGVTVLIGRAAGTPFYGEVFLLLFGGAATSVTGLGVGFYYYQFQARYEDLQRSFERAKRLSKELSVTHRVLRHNLRNELTVVDGHTEMADAANGSDPAAVDEHLDVVSEHVRELLRTCEKAAELSKIAPDATPYPLDAVAELEAAIAVIQERYPTAEITTSTPDTAPVLAHPRLRTALEELVENAIVHTDDEVTVSASVDAASGPSGRTLITISDDGSGIPPVEVESLRQPEEDPLAHGQGLGLWVVYTVVEQSGGELSFREDSARGTTVTISLRPYDGDQSPVGDAAAVP